MTAQSADDFWQDSRADLPLDHEGPTDVAFEQFEDGWIEQPIVDRFNQVVARYGDKTAVVDETTRMTYRELQRASLRLACHIEALVPVGQPVGILLPNNALFPLAALACLAIGRPYVPIDPQYPRTRIDQIRQEAGLSAMVVSRIEGRDFDGEWSVPCLDIGISFDGVDEWVPAVATSDGPAVILYTSGSTGQPKGICNDQRAILQRVAQATNSCHLNANDRFFLLSSPGTIAGVRETFAALLNGATLHVADPTRLGINGVLRMFRDARTTVGYIVPALLRQLLASPDAREALAHARVVRIGGDIPVADDLALCRALLPSTCHILIAFSSTEVPTIFQWFIPRRWNPDGIRLPIGYARPGMKFRVEDDGVAAEDGELVVKSHYLALGYWQGGRLQQCPFQSDPADPSVRILRTGDRVRLRPDGLAEMIGRVDRQVKIRGYRVNLAEVEAVLRGCDGVADAAVIARRHGEDVTALVAYVVPRDPPRVTFTIDLKNVIAERLPWRLRPAQYRVLDALPRLHGFKTDIQALERLDQHELAAQVAIASPPTQPYMPTEQVLLQLCRDVFQIATLGIHDNFFDSGADSLSALTLLLEIERYWRVTITIADMFSAPTVAEFAKVIDQAADRSQAPQLAIIQAGASLPPFFCLGAGPRYRELARLLGPKQPFIGPVHPRPAELSGAIKIEDVAAHFIRIIRAAQPQGPYFLGGWCIDGLVAYEVAQQLQALGENVALLVLFDTSFYSSWLVVIYGHVRTSVIMRTERVLAVIKGWRWRKILAYLRRKSVFLRDSVQRLVNRGQVGEPRGMIGWMDLAVQRRAAEAYRPLPYNGRVLHLQRSVWQTPWTRARQDWSSLVRHGYETYDIPGDHVGMFEKDNVVFTAEKLSVGLCAAQETFGITEKEAEFALQDYR